MPGTFADAEPNYERESVRRDFFSHFLHIRHLDPPKPVCRAVKSMQATDIRDEDILLATPILYGFSLAEKLWRSYIMI